MGRFLFGSVTLTWASVLLGSVGMAAMAMGGGGRGGATEETVPPARGSDPEEVVRLDFESAMKLGTANALCLFIRHNADHPLAREARRILRENFQTAEGDDDDASSDPCAGLAAPETTP